MKKQYIILGSLLLVAASSLLQAAPMETIRTNLDRARNTIINKKSPEFGRNLQEWKEAFLAAKTFVIDNSKNLVGIKDSDIINAMNDIQKENDKLVAMVNSFELEQHEAVAGSDQTASKAIENLNQLINNLNNIKDNLQKAINKFNTLSVTLSNKKNAKLVIDTIKTCLDHMINHIRRIYSEKIERIPSERIKYLTLYKKKHV